MKKKLLKMLVAAAVCSLSLGTTVYAAETNISTKDNTDSTVTQSKDNNEKEEKASNAPAENKAVNGSDAHETSSNSAEKTDRNTVKGDDAENNASSTETVGQASSEVSTKSEAENNGKTQNDTSSVNTVSEDTEAVSDSGEAENKPSIFDIAPTIKENTETTNVLTNANEQHVYKINPSQGKLTVYLDYSCSVSSAEPDVDIFLIRYNAEQKNGNIVAYSNYGPGDYELLSYIINSSNMGAYYILVNNCSSNFAETNYRLDVLNTKQFDSNEGDDYVSARNVYNNVPKVINQTIDNDFDEDWMEINVDSAKEYRVNLQNFNPNSTYLLKIYDSNFKLVANVQNNSYAQFNFNKGKYYMRMLSLGGSSPSNLYSINFVDMSKFNNKETMVDTENFVNGTLTSSDDERWYVQKITDSNMHFGIQLLYGGGDSKYVVDVYDANLRLMGTVNQDTLTNLNLSNKGTYYFRVRSLTGEYTNNIYTVYFYRDGTYNLDKEYSLLPFKIEGGLSSSKSDEWNQVDFNKDTNVLLEFTSSRQDDCIVAFYDSDHNLCCILYPLAEGKCYNLTIKKGIYYIRIVGKKSYGYTTSYDLKMYDKDRPETYQTNTLDDAIGRLIYTTDDICKRIENSYNNGAYSG